MLQNLHIENYALIENLDIDFKSGFSVITGETGAGKSIILGALSIILGNRADSSVISNGAKRCVAEATFNIKGLGLEDFFEENDLDLDNDECIIRRELTSAGKSRAFVNDTPVQLSILKQLSDSLIDVHSQHQNLLLNDSGFQMSILDSVANCYDELNKYSEVFKQYRSEYKSLQELKASINEKQENADYLQFQFNEISSVNLVDGEQEELEEEQLLLDNAENIKQSLYDANSALTDVVRNIRKAQHSLNHIEDVFPKVQSLAERLESCGIEIDDIDTDISSSLSDASFDPIRSEFVNERLNAIYSLQKKYRKETVAELLQLQASLSQQLNNITNGDELISEKEQLCKKLEKEARTLAKSITDLRQKAARKIEKELVARLKPLGMPNVEFKVELNQTEVLQSNGQDETSFLFSANKNVPLRSIAKIASGGEIARVMLSLKSLISQHKQLPTIIFDEIDTGVSGKIADEMAIVMNNMGQNGRQVICITHLPQIASKGEEHYRVFKTDTTDLSHTHIEQLTTDMRIQEIAKMLSGSTITEAAISNAKTLLNL